MRILTTLTAGALALTAAVAAIPAGAQQEWNDRGDRGGDSYRRDDNGYRGEYRGNDRDQTNYDRASRYRDGDDNRRRYSAPRDRKVYRSYGFRDYGFRDYGFRDYGHSSYSSSGRVVCSEWSYETYGRRCRRTR